MTRKEIDLEIARGLFSAKLMPLDVVLQNSHTLVSNVLNQIRRGLDRDGLVKIAGFGTFKMDKVEARMRYNPTTGERVEEPEHELIKFVPSAKLRERVAMNRRKGRNTPLPECPPAGEVIPWSAFLRSRPG